MQKKPQTNVTDIVCGMKLEMQKATCAVEHERELYYFCSNSCKD